MRVIYTSPAHTALVQNARTLTGVQIFFGKMQKLNVAHFGAPFLLLL